MKHPRTKASKREKGLHRKTNHSMLGFTRREIGVLLFLIIGFVVGLGVWMYREHWEPLPQISEEIEEKRQTDEEEIERKIQVSLNQATQKELETIPGIGPMIAKRIVLYREQWGDFHSIDELVNVQGIGKKTIEKMKPYLILNEHL